MGEKSDRFTWGPGELKLSQCAYCVHKDKSGATCTAFPDGIPEDILDNEVIHDKPYPGDHGVLYEQCPGGDPFRP